MNTLDFKEGQTYICTKSNKRWFTVGKEYPVFLDSDNEPAIRDDDGDDWHSSYLSISNNQFKLKEEQPKVTLDEPQKPVVPKFVADWIELCKEKADLISCLSGSYEYGVNQYKRITEDEDWLFEADHQELVARAWLYSYEVEKEPLYRVKIGEGYFVEYQGRGALIMPDCNKEIKIFDSKSDAERTAQTIGGTVEEVVEG
ncbi:DUF1642 domain-containing protein [Enterococcus faecium]|uniref:DUF1642 domain-containing protein n=1 Tax=Enterococcus faecium TaxID=1352 RepID=UPI000CF33509|nr:DUF1642 domain-containing protein [Enterococcus faecium]PQG57113.1 hypothetical protein CUS15_04050 [Enterococcus faecium]RBT08221.1 hypothetical protein EA87_00964 [Enterococcus faecium]